MLREFGIKRNPKSVQQVVNNISEEDLQLINSIYENYGYNPDKAFQTEYPKWFNDFEKQKLMELTYNLTSNITHANSIYPTMDCEWELRRGYQDSAIGDCYSLTQELQYITSIFVTDLNKMPPLLDMIEREVELIKGWRRSDNQVRKK